MAGGRLFNSDDEDDLLQSNESLEDDILEQEEQLDEELAEAEHRFNLGSYYRQLAKGGIFKDGTEAAKIVDAEVRAFARERMAILLNLSTAPKPKIEMPFSDRQIEVLQVLADRYDDKLRQGSTPVVRPLLPPPHPQALQSARPTTPVITPLTSPANAQRAPIKARKKPTDKPVTVNYDAIPDGEVFLENGKHYKLVTNPENGQRLKMKVNLEKQVTPPNRTPMPSASDMETLSAQQAQNQALRAPIVESDKTYTIGKQ